MNKKFLLASKLLQDNSMAVINSYESLPTQHSPRTLVTSYKDSEEDKYANDQKYNFMTLNKMDKIMNNQEEDN